jgi:hypothetical protein
MSALALASLLVLAAAAPTHHARAAITAPPAALGLPSFYHKYLDAHGPPVVASSRPPDQALRVAADIVDAMLSTRPDVRRRLIEKHVRVAVMSATEVTTDIPEHAGLSPFMNQRARGLGATAAAPVCSCAEENLLQYPDDRYRGENILVHEFAHTIHVMALTGLDSTFDARLEQCYRNAIRNGRFASTYAETNAQEYWAEGVQSWFDANQHVAKPDGIHNEIHTREGLQKYDPELSRLIADEFPGNAWRWKPPSPAGTP